MSEIRKWLEAIGLGQYGDAFEANKIDMDLLGQVDDQILKDIGISAAGDRLRIRNAIAKLAQAPVADANLTATTSKHETAAASAERRQLTVMFCDLVGSTALSAQLDPEDLRSIIGAYHRCCAEVITKSGGFVAKYMGDGVLAYFGYPRAHEEDAERAVRAGLALVDVVPKLEGHGGTALQVRVGIATGLVVVGDLIGEGAAQEQAVVGEAPNLAARLQALAEPAAVVIASSTRRLTRGLFEYRDLGTVALKGFANVPAYQVSGLGAAEGRFEALRTATTLLVGRVEEIELLLRRWEQAKGGDGQVVLISGEPGIGKSRIAQTIVEGISAEPHTRLRYFCSPHHQDSALHPSIAQLERAAGLRREDTTEQRLAKLEAVLAQGTHDLSKAVPLLADLLSIPTGERYPPLNLTPQKRKERTLHAQLVQVEGLAARQPVLMVFEDLHWSDPTTRELLDLLVDRVATLRVLVILTFRPEFTPPWEGRPHVTMLTLDRLPARQRAEMIVHVTSGKVLPKEIEQQIVDRTDGVPLFIEELTKTVVESGILTETGDRYTVTGPVGPLAIPTSLQASLLARLDRLAPTREVAQIGASLGRSFSYELISAVARMPKQQIDDGLGQLVSAELIFRRGSPPDAEYTFKHALVQDAAYSTLLRSRRQQIHARIAAVLEADFGDRIAAEPELLARHLTDAELLEKAVRWWLRAGERATERSANLEAIGHLKRGIDIVGRFPESRERDEQELLLQVALIAPTVAIAAGPRQPARRAVELGARIGVDSPAQFQAILARVWLGDVLAITGELRSALPFAAETLSIAERLGDPLLLSRAHYSIGQVHQWLGDLGEARRHLEENLALYDPERDRGQAARFGWDTNTGCHALLGVVLWDQGFPDKALRHAEEAIAAGRAAGHPFSEALALLFQAMVHQLRGEATLCLDRASAALALATEQGLRLLAGGAKTLVGWALVKTAREEGLAEVREGIDALGALSARAWRSLSLPLLLEASLALGQIEEGLSAAREGLAEVEQIAAGCYEPALNQLQGQLLLASKEPDETGAEAAFRKAIAIARAQQAKSVELRAVTSLARHLVGQGKRTEAHDLLAPVYNWFTEGFDTPVLQDAKALLGELA